MSLGMVVTVPNGTKLSHVPLRHRAASPKWSIVLSKPEQNLWRRIRGSTRFVRRTIIKWPEMRPVRDAVRVARHFSAGNFWTPPSRVPWTAESSPAEGAVSLQPGAFPKRADVLVQPQSSLWDSSLSCRITPALTCPAIFLASTGRKPANAPTFRSVIGTDEIRPQIRPFMA